MSLRILMASLCVAGFALAPLAAEAAKTPFKRDLSKEFEDLTPSEQIAIRAAAKAAYKAKKLGALNVCADPGNMPFSNDKGEGFENKIANVLGEAMGAKVNFFWRPFLERGMTRQTFDAGMCDVMIDIPVPYGSLLTTMPIYRTTYVLAYRNDKGIDIKGFDDPQLKKLRIGVFQTSGVREVLARNGIVDNVSLAVVTHDGDLKPEHQPFWQVQQVVNGDLDVAAVWGPFAGWGKAKGEPLVVQPVNLWEDKTPLEFDLGIGVRKTDAFLKYMLDFALEDKADEIAKILEDYGVPLVQCSKCIVPGTLPAHGSYTAVAQTDFKARPDLASPDQVVTKEKVENWLAEGADITQELSNAVIANDFDRVKFLASKGADVNKADNQAWTPLQSAARQRHDKMIALLIDLGADVNAGDPTPLVSAVMRDHVPSVKVLLEHGADMEKPGQEDFKPLPLAIASDKYESAKALMEAGADVNSLSGDDALTPLMIAAGQTSPAEGAMFVPGSTRPTDIAQGLLARGANVNAQSKSGVTPLMIAATHNNPPMIGILIDAGADVTLKNKLGQTAADVAELNGNLESQQAIMVLSRAKAAASTPTPDTEKSTSQ